MTNAARCTNFRRGVAFSGLGHYLPRHPLFCETLTGALVPRQYSVLTLVIREVGA